MKHSIYIFTLFIVSCNIGIKNVSHQDIENFDSFYQKFHEDSAFQISRILFPIKGVKFDVMNYNPLDSNKIVEFIWTKENWDIHKKITDSTIKIETVKTDTVVKQHIYIENSGFQVERDFKLMSNKWYLFYYSYRNI